jgi:nucleoside-diphosphate-sugar epimerase
LLVLVVGGAGYIGSHVAHALKRRGHEVLTHDNPSTGHAALAQGFELIVGDISDSTELTSAGLGVAVVANNTRCAVVREISSVRRLSLLVFPQAPSVQCF